MKKAMIALALTIALVATSAWALEPRQSFSTKLVEKDPTDWSIVKGGAYGTFGGYQSTAVTWENGWKEYYNADYLYFMSGWNVLPKYTDYTVIYYGDAEHNDVWPYATCIMSGNSGSYGYLKLNGAADAFEWSDLMNDGIDQKFWLVLSSDVDCDQGKMTAWNPTEYLFEVATI